MTRGSWPGALIMPNVPQSTHVSGSPIPVRLDIEHVRAELNSDSFCYPRVLHNPKILASVAWSPSVRQETGRIAKTKSEGVDGRTRWRRKRSGVQVLRPVDDVQTVRGQGLRDSGDNICAQPARCRAT